MNKKDRLERYLADKELRKLEGRLTFNEQKVSFPKLTLVKDKKEKV